MGSSTMDAEASSSSTASSDVSGGWSHAAAIGVLAGIPTAAFLQVGFIKTLRERGVGVAKSRVGVPGIGYAVVRDVGYWTATQKQVQTPTPTMVEELTMQFGVVVLPLVTDTLSVRVAEKGFVLPKEPGKLFAVACPPVALLGRMTWIPLYNYAYVLAQQRIGDSTPIQEFAGLLAGSLAASFVAYPLFIFKTNLLLCHDGGGALDARKTLKLCGDATLRSFGASSLPALRAAGAAAALSAVFKGSVPHAVANIGPDVACMAAARWIYKAVAGEPEKP